MARPRERRLSMLEPPLLVIMAKAPVCGAVNTRLAKDVGRGGRHGLGADTDRHASPGGGPGPALSHHLGDIA